MNTNQITSLIQTVIAGVCGYFVSQGKLDNSTATQITAGVVALLTLAVAHVVHSEPPSPPPNKPSIPLMAIIAALGISAFPFMAFIAALGIFAVTFGGCASAPENAYKAESAADITVTAAMTAWENYVAQNHPPAAAEQAVENAFEKYQQAELAAIDATSAYVAATGTNSGADNSGMTAAATDATNALNDLENLLKSFGVTF